MFDVLASECFSLNLSLRLHAMYHHLNIDIDCEAAAPSKILTKFPDDQTGKSLLCDSHTSYCLFSALVPVSFKHKQT